MHSSLCIPWQGATITVVVPDGVPPVVPLSNAAPGTYLPTGLSSPAGRAIYVTGRDLGVRLILEGQAPVLLYVPTGGARIIAPRRVVNVEIATFESAPQDASVWIEATQPYGWQSHARERGMRDEFNATAGSE
jgi:hypothetical protein